jgi:iron complex outermembrane receptor protein
MKAHWRCGVLANKEGGSRMRLHRKFHSLAAGALVISTWAAAATAQVAQPASPTQSNSAGSAQAGSQSRDQLEEVVVTGIRASLDQALDTKREAVGFVDAINAEDVGKLPDQNVAEALQRMTGVSIQRSRGEGDFVSIRGLGPNFVRGTINSRSVVSSTESRDATRSGGFESSTGRETNFDLLPAEMIASIEVTKSPSASQVEGAIGGGVDIKTQHPLALGTTAVASARGTYRDFNKKFDPSASGLASWTDESKTFGVLGAIAYSQRTIREDDPDSFGYTTSDRVVDTDGNGTGDRTGLSFPFSFNPQSFTEKRKRLTLQGSVQWQLPDESRLVIDALYSKRDLTSRAFVSFLGTCCGFQGASADVRNPDGSIRVPGIQIAAGTAVAFPVKSQISDNSDDQTVNDRLYTIGANYYKALGDWDLGVDLAYSRSRGELNFNRVSLLTLDVVPFRVTESHDQLQLTMQPGGPDLTNPANYRTNNVDVVDRFNRDHEFDADLGVTRKLPDNGFIGAMRLGGHYSERNVDREDHTNFNVNTDQLNAALLPASGFRHFDGNFANGTSSYPMGSLLFGDWAAQTALLKSKNPNASFAAPYAPLQSFRINEKTTAGYLQADIDSLLAGIAIKGNVGVRFVHTRSAATGFFQPFRIDNDPDNDNLGTIITLDPNILTTEFDNSYNNVLPMLNLRAQLLHDLYLRFAAGRSLTRPTFLQLSPGLSGINPTQRFANSGNPDLKAYQSNNYDLGLEWYFGKGNAIYASVFRKDIDNFIGTVTHLNVDAFGVNFRSVSKPENQGNAHITGEEIGIQQTFALGVGYILNATFIDSNAHFTEGSNAGKNIPFEGVSRTSYNATLFYETGGFSTRLSYSGRSSYVLLSSDVFANRLITAPYGQLDGSISYTFDHRWTIFANGINLGGAADRIYSDTTLQPLSWSYVGRRYEIGVKARL